MKGYKKEILLLVLLIVTVALTSCIGGPDIEDVRAKIEKALYEKYGEEFVVDRIGIRTSQNQKFYQARIYPKSIIGTTKEYDDYYYASASVDKLSFGKLGEVGDSYSYVSRNIEMEKYLLPHVIKVFGDRVLLKVDVAHKVTGDGSWWAGYKSASLEEMNKKIESNPEKNRMELELNIYIFDRIEDKEEKEKRREEIFKYVQYLKEEGLFDFLELGVIFIDERVLAPSYQDYSNKVYFSDEVAEFVDGETVYLPPMDLRKEMTIVLEKEIAKMKEKELLSNMSKIKKSDLTYKKIVRYNEQYLVWICSLKMLRSSHQIMYENYKSQGKLEFYYYKNIGNILFGKNKKYVYLK